MLLEAFGRLGLDRKGIIGVTMPGPGTTARTRLNAMRLMEALGITAREIPIGAALDQRLRTVSPATTSTAAITDTVNIPSVADATACRCACRPRGWCSRSARWARMRPFPWPLPRRTPPKLLLI